MNSAAESSDAGITPLECTAALAHHWLVRRRGGEKVFEALRELFPSAPIHTLLHDPDEVDYFPAEIHTSFLQRFPGARRFYPVLLPLMPLAARRMHLPEVDLVVCSDAAIAKAMRPHERSVVVCYCHSPMRYVWESRIRKQYRASLPRAARLVFDRTIARVRAADLAAAQRVDLFVANSQHVARRIHKHYKREALVVHPPVALPAKPPTLGRENFFLCVGQHVAYKRLDLAVHACVQLNVELVVIGEGPDVRKLRRQVPPNITFLGYQPDEVLEDCYARARGLLFPGEEDFGIVPVEAMARGCPVVAFGVGGACETVVDGKTGVLFAEQTVDSLAAAIQRALQLRFDPDEMHAHAQRFGRRRFQDEMRATLADALAAGRQS